MAEKSEEIIFLRRAREGDFAAFGELIRKYQSLVYAVALPIVSDPSAAEDVTQDTFVSAFQSLKDLRSDDSFPAWLHSIARNRALARLRERNPGESVRTASGLFPLLIRRPVSRSR